MPWSNIPGPQGPAGATGPQGAAGASGTAAILARTVITHTSMVTSAVGTATTLGAMNFNSDGTNRYAKVTFTAPSSGNVVVRIEFDAAIVNSAAVMVVGLHDSSASTSTPVDGCYRVNADNDDGSGIFWVQFVLTGLTPGNTYTRYFLVGSDFSSSTIRAGQYWTTYTKGTGTQVGPVNIWAYDFGAPQTTTNPAS